MRVQALGHSGVLVEVRDVRIVCDPWLSPHGAFTASWFQLPCNHHLASELLDAPITAVYVSHEHDDHFDVDFLRRVPRDVHLIVPDFPSPYWKEKVSELAFERVSYLKDEERIDLGGGVNATVMHAQTSGWHDSAIVIDDTLESRRLVNLNDCKINRAQAARIRNEGKVDVALAQFSGASWFPFVYEADSTERAGAALDKRVNGMGRWSRYMSWLEPRFAVPFAGPPIFLAEDLQSFFFGADSIFPTPPQLLEWLDANHKAIVDSVRVLLPGDSIDADGVLSTDPRNADFRWDDIAAYTLPYSQMMRENISVAIEAHSWPEEPLFPAFANYFEQLFLAAPHSAQQVNARVLFDVSGMGGGRWLVDFRQLTIEDLGQAPGQEEYAFRFSSRYARSIVEQKMRWENLFLSLRFAAWRPTIGDYNEELMTFLKMATPGELALREDQIASNLSMSTDAPFFLSTDAGSFEVDPRCPHAGEILSAQDYDSERSVIVCPRHGWIFEIPSGRCLNGRARLGVRPQAIDTSRSGVKT